jgi:O-antigen ligase
MRAAIDKLYFFVVVCANADVFGRILGGHADLSAGSRSSAFSSGSSDPVLLAINAVIAFATLFLVLPKLPQIFAMLGRLKYVLVPYLFAALSIVWSVDRASTFRNAVYLFLYLVSAAYISLRFENEEIFALIGEFMAVLALLSIPGQFILPQDPFQAGRWRGIFLQKNDLGAAMAIGIVALVVSNRPWKLIRIGTLALCATLLVLSQSFTAIVAATAATLITLYMRLHSHVRLLFLTTVLGAAIIVSIAVSSLSSAFSETTGRDLTFTGRTEVWALVLKKIVVHPLLGYGYGAFWPSEGESINQFLNWQPGQAHDGFLEISLNLGITGLALVLFLIRDALRRARRVRKNFGHFAGLSMLSLTWLLLFHNFAEVDFLLVHLMWFVFIITYFSCWRIEITLFEEFLANNTSASQEPLTIGELVS